jgi:dCTP deaminase
MERTASQKGSIMGLQPDSWIRRHVEESRMIEPFVERQVRDGVISFGLSSYGYDIRVAEDFKVFTAGLGDLAVVDPKHLDTRAMVDFRGEVCIIPPNSFALARSVEYFRMPRDVLGAVLGKSTYARCGIVTNFTPLEPGWEGFITIEISNTTPLPAKIYAGEGIAQVLFFQGDAPPEVSYADKRGKYQGQQGIVLPRI